MKPYKFTTKIREDGTIILPEDKVPFSKGKKVQVVILDTSDTEKSEADKASEDTSAVSSGVTGAAEFVGRWRGFLEGKEVDDARYTYLINKYK